MTNQALAERMEQLADALDRLTATIQETTAMFTQPADTDTGCLHPEDSRTNLSTMGKPGRFLCRDCGFRND